MKAKEWTITVRTYDFDTYLTEDECTAFLLDEYEETHHVRETSSILFSSDDYAETKQKFEMCKDSLVTLNDYVSGQARLHFVFMSKDEYSAVYGTWIVPDYKLEMAS